MDMEMVVSALNSKNRRQILRVLSKYWGYPSDALTLKEVMSELTQDPAFSVKRRESIYKALEILVKCGLAEKRYEKGRGMCYRVVKKKIEINLAKESIE
jgi:Fe2+ or Zn2+ uptake regulation protein